MGKILTILFSVKMKKKITRKNFITQGAAALAGTSLLSTACGNDDSQQNVSSSGVASGKKFRWKMVTTWPPNLPVLDEGCKLMAKWVKEMSGGRLDIRVFGANELVPALEVFEAVSNGAAEMGNSSAYYWAGKVPAAQFFSTVPFGMNAQQANAWINHGGGQALWDEIYEPFGVRGFTAGNTGVQMGGWFNREINSIADLKGLKMRIPGLGGKVMTRAGATAANVAGSEIYTNLERGVIDATEWIGPYHDYSMGFNKIAKYYYTPGWHEPGTVLEALVNKSKFEELPSDLQEILKSAIYRQNLWTLSEFEQKNAIYLEKLIAENDVEIRSFPEEVLNRLREATTEVLAEMVQNDPLSKKVYDSYLAFKKSSMGWSRVSERAYYDQIQV